MSRGFPSMTALLGLLAVAGFQNWDKIAEMLRGAGSSSPGAPGPGQQQSGLGGLLGNLVGVNGGVILVLPQFACCGVVVLGRGKHIRGTSLLAESRPCPSASYL